jgi:hypothetical protein
LTKSFPPLKIRARIRLEKLSQILNWKIYRFSQQGCREMHRLKEDVCNNPLNQQHYLCQAMTLLKSRNWTQGHSVLANLDEASPRKPDKGKETEGHSIVLEISSKEELMLCWFKL